TERSITVVSRLGMYGRAGSGRSGAAEGAAGSAAPAGATASPSRARIRRTARRRVIRGLLWAKEGLRRAGRRREYVRVGGRKVAGGSTCLSASPARNLTMPIALPPTGRGGPGWGDGACSRRYRSDRSDPSDRSDGLIEAAS